MRWRSPIVADPAMQANLEQLGGLLYTGLGDPNGVVRAPIGALYLRLDGGAGSTLYVKESGDDESGWAAK